MLPVMTSLSYMTMHRLFCRLLHMTLSWVQSNATYTFLWYVIGCRILWFHLVYTLHVEGKITVGRVGLRWC